PWPKARNKLVESYIALTAHVVIRILTAPGHPDEPEKGNKNLALRLQVAVRSRIGCGDRVHLGIVAAALTGWSASCGHGERASRDVGGGVASFNAHDERRSLVRLQSGGHRSELSACEAELDGLGLASGNRRRNRLDGECSGCRAVGAPAH